MLEGAGRLDFGDRPRFDIAIRARQIDIDRVARRRRGCAGRRWRRRLRRCFARPRDLPRPALPGALHFDAQGLVIGGSVVQAVGLDVEPTADGWKIADFAAMLPGETRVDVQGTLRTSGALALPGARPREIGPPVGLRVMVARSGRLGRASSRALRWRPTSTWSRACGSSPTSRRRPATGTVRGSVEFRRFQQSGELFATVNLNADRADLAEASALTELLTGQSLWAGRVDQMTLSLRADVLAARGIEAHSVVRRRRRGGRAAAAQPAFHRRPGGRRDRSARRDQGSARRSVRAPRGLREGRGHQRRGRIPRRARSRQRAGCASRRPGADACRRSRPTYRPRSAAPTSRFRST